ncbi:flagellar protein FlaG [Pelomicrobium methylotrophicum]|uniref:Flagellar protein FlaG n=2 Tax=Pelomicrobium methylotrophicum TaxID=2602750 RepID=A0A5C7EK24_9PROT|nr:flagellar protein FlaG [Pelomicrobium methylotrophicum]
MMVSPIGHPSEPEPMRPVEVLARERVQTQGQEAAPWRADPAANETQLVDEAQLREATRWLNAALRHLTVELRYATDEVTRKLVVQVVDGATGEILRQIPPEEVLAIARGLERVQGLLLDREA